jgi:hypothetical protein
MEDGFQIILNRARWHAPTPSADPSTLSSTHQ